MALMNYKMIKNYTEAENYLGNKNKRPLAYKTKLIRRDSETIAVRHHDTDIIVYYQDGTIILDNGGFYSPTTKERMNLFTPSNIRIYQEKSIWFVSDPNIDKDITFTRPTIIEPDGTIEPTHTVDLKHEQKRLKQINKYAQLCCDSIPLSLPGPGDCLYCHLTNDNKTLGDAIGNPTHLESHMEEGYVVPSLVWRALVENGYDPERNSIIFSMVFDKESFREGLRSIAEIAVKGSVRKYLKKRFGYAY